MRRETDGRPYISVQMPVYNRAGFLAEAVESVAAQTVNGIELVIVDDGSTDETPRVLEKLSKDPPEGLVLRIVRKKHDGIAAARNRALRESSGSYIAFLDSDDLWQPDKAEKQLRFLEAHPECGIVFCRYRNFLSPGDMVMTPDKKRLSEETDPWYLASAMIRREVFSRIGGYAEKMIVGEDSEWVTRARLLGENIDCCIEEELYLRRVHGSNISLGYPGGGANYGTVLAESIRNAKRVKRRKNADFGTDPGL